MNFKPLTQLRSLILCGGLLLGPPAQAAAGRPAETNTTLQLAVRFHIIADLVMDKNGLKMDSWVTEKDISKIILPEVNRIWHAAHIAFTLEQVLPARALNPPDKQQLIAAIVSARRDESGKSDPARVKNLHKLISFDKDNPQVINVYLVPYMGETSQGVTIPQRKRVIVGQWSDKATHASQAPEKFQLTEQGAFKKGSFSRTLAHELGHVLGLKHPDKNDQKEFDLLMGGKRPGCRLTPEEIKTAQQQARSLRSPA